MMYVIQLMMGIIHWSWKENTAEGHHNPKLQDSKFDGLEPPFIVDLGKE